MSPLRRSVLFMPATNARALAKAQTLPADCLILDLEDAVLPAHKLDARQALVSALSTHDFGDREVLVRVNGVDTQWCQDDLAALAGSGVAGIVLPKVERTSEIAAVAGMMASIDDGPAALWIMLETPAGVLNAVELCAFGGPLVAMLVGTADLGQSLKVPATAWREGMQWTLSQCVIAARAGGISAIDGVFVDVDDLDGLQRECEQGRDFGFDGKSVIHPNQLAMANRFFSPTPEQLQAATDLVIAWKVSEREGQAVCLHEGRLVEQLHVRQAEALLALASAIEKRESDQ